MALDTSVAFFVPVVALLTSMMWREERLWNFCVL
jgi:hypothetical protein